VTSLAERIASAVSKPSIVANRDLTVTASVGIAISKAGDTVESLLGNADIAMYQAKKQGRDRIEVFFDSLGSLAQSRFEVEAAIREGLKAGQFDVYYQTQNDLGSANVHGFEALVRWRHPDRGLLVPAQFLTIAEEAGLLGAIGDQVLRQAFAECGATLAATTLELAVNVIPTQVARPGFADWLLELLHDHDVAPEQLCLEMPETSLFATTGPAADTLRTLATHGIRLAVDDFGTGFASLSTLAELPISVLKIDRSFVARLNNLRRNDDAIIAAVINLSDRLGIQVIAEGVETQQQADQLRRLGCHVGQGLHYCVPAPWREIYASAGPAALRKRDRIQKQAS
jgi:EAL domain-containing protein (putative c-di-GMP-specific phosphodiesterase class I)